MSHHYSYPHVVEIRDASGDRRALVRPATAGAELRQSQRRLVEASLLRCPRRGGGGNEST